jgi:RHS repeat-associated protein
LFGRLLSSRLGRLGGGTGLIHSLVDWDLNGNLIQRQDLKLSPQVTETFEYDALDRFDRSLRNGGQNFDVALDAIGNITSRQVNADPAQSYDYVNPQAGCSYYSHAQPRAVRKVGTTVYCYDPNGNMTKRAGSAISYTSYNLPSVINAPGNYSSTISYGAFRNRYKQVAIGPQGTETTIYVAGLLEKVTNAQGTHYRHLIQGGQGTAAIHSRTVGGGNATVYLHRDHLGSPELITDSAGNELIRPSFAAYGERRDGSDWDGAISSADLNTLAGISRRGFTGHEHLDAVGLIHMNGRVYEPVAGRFLSRDPFIDGVFSSQGINGHAYVHNNPLTLNDPSGFCGEGPEAEPCYLDGLSPGDTYRHRDLPPTWTHEHGGRAHGARSAVDAVTGNGGDLRTERTVVMYGFRFIDMTPQGILMERLLELRDLGLLDWIEFGTWGTGLLQIHLTIADVAEPKLGETSPVEVVRQSPRGFLRRTVTLDDTLFSAPYSPGDTLLILFHELVHVGQFASSYDYGRDSRVVAAERFGFETEAMRLTYRAAKRIPGISNAMKRILSRGVILDVVLPPVCLADPASCMQVVPP